MNTLNAALKSVTYIETVSGLRVDLSTQLSKNFQMGGTWQYNKAGSTFSLNTALVGDYLVQDSSFLAGSYHDDGKLESKSMLQLGKGFALGMEAQFQDANKGYCCLELNKAFECCTASIKWGNMMRGFSYMQSVLPNLYAGFECSYVVSFLPTLA